MSKYRNVRTEVDGHGFASIAEANRYIVLCQMQEDGEIRDLRLQPKYQIADSFRDRNGKKHRPILYIGDFAYTEAETLTSVCEDVKSIATKTQTFKVKWHIVQLIYPEIVFRIVEI